MRNSKDSQLKIANLICKHMYIYVYVSLLIPEINCS